MGFNISTTQNSTVIACNENDREKRKVKTEPCVFCTQRSGYFLLWNSGKSYSYEPPKTGNSFKLILVFLLIGMQRLASLIGRSNFWAQHSLLDSSD